MLKKVFIVWSIVLLLIGCGSSSDKNETDNGLNPNADKPVFTSPDKIDFTENSTESIIITATDSNDVDFEINGRDRRFFRIFQDENESSATLDFIDAPDYETKKVYKLTVIADDGFAENKTTQKLTINITDVDETVADTTPPKFSSAKKTFTIDENKISIGKVVATDTNRINYYISGGQDASSFTLDSSRGTLEFKVAPNYEVKKTYEVKVTAEDSKKNKSVQTIIVKIRNVNETVTDTTAPTLTLPKTIKVYENETYVIRVEATDINSIQYSISGTDANIFTIDNTTGILRFKVAPDYEKRTVYYLDIIATDSKGNVKKEPNIKIIILNVTEPTIDNTPPTFTSSSSVSVNENQMSAITLRATDSNSITYSISGTDVGYLNVDSSTGIVTFKVAPNYEIKTSYSFTAKATDSKGNSATKIVSINIIDINEVSESDYFITTWKTDNNGTSNSKQIIFPAYTSSPYTYSIDWGDGTKDTELTWNITHTYKNSGTYTIKIFGEFLSISFNKYDDFEKIISIEQWGKIKWKYLSFENCSNLIGNFSDIPNLSNVTSMDSMFAEALSFNQNIDNWDVSTITSMSNMFSGTSYTKSLNSWDVSNVTDMSGMFNGAKFNKTLNSWDVSSVENMELMFGSLGCEFNGDIASWDTSNVKNMFAMFWNNINFNQKIGTWNVSNVTDMSYMFTNAKKFNQNINQWDVSNVVNMEGMFKNYDGIYDEMNIEPLFNQDISSWNVSNVINMSSMFLNVSSFSNQNLSSWDVLSVQEYEKFSNNWGTGNTEPNWNK